MGIPANYLLTFMRERYHFDLWKVWRFFLASKEGLASEAHVLMNEEVVFFFFFQDSCRVGPFLWCHM